ncbi:uncharacterized protein [Drosophila virilis]|uniref:DUF4806 domain-containing protein n=2 Tax=Drosophila virilis TaxID=7244 RepID=B4LEB3_DROVI|nr:uncharacterized protein LOC6623131 isoform X1 [Drosophila virilis]EDW70089.2 uncharacterized protein Dvir_GJ11755 [Drosophila virilis]
MQKIKLRKRQKGHHSHRKPLRAKPSETWVSNRITLSNISFQKEGNVYFKSQSMSGRGRNARRSAEKAKKEFIGFDDPLGIDMNISVKDEVICPDMLPTPDDDIFGMVDSQDLVDEQQKMQRLYPMDMGPNEHHNFNDRLSSLERKVDFLLNINTKILARVDKICENMKSVTKPNDFPVKHKEALEAIDLKIANDMEKYTELFKNLLSPSGIVKNIGRIIDQKLLMEMNYGGHSSKAGLSSYINLNTALYESQRTEGYTFDDYRKDARMAFQKAKNRVYKAVSEARKLKRLNGEIAESNNQDNDTNECKEKME